MLRAMLELEKKSSVYASIEMTMRSPTPDTSRRRVKTIMRDLSGL
jgi:hypothetical protein